MCSVWVGGFTKFDQWYISLYPPVPQTPTSGIGCFFRNVCGRRLQGPNRTTCHLGCHPGEKGFTKVTFAQAMYRYITLAQISNDKNCVFSGMFVPLETTMLVFAMFLQHQDQTSPKRQLFTRLFLRMRRKESLLRCFSDKGLTMYRKYQCFLHFYYFQLLKQTNRKTMFSSNFSDLFSWGGRCSKMLWNYSVL